MATVSLNANLLVPHSCGSSTRYLRHTSKSFLVIILWPTYYLRRGGAEERESERARERQILGREGGREGGRRRETGGD